jgi:hypothetical protein
MSSARSNCHQGSKRPVRQHSHQTMRWRTSALADMQRTMFASRPRPQRRYPLIRPPSATASIHQTLPIHLSQLGPAEKQSSDYIWTSITQPRRLCVTSFPCRASHYNQSRAFLPSQRDGDHTVARRCLSQAHHSMVPLPTRSFR